MSSYVLISFNEFSFNFVSCVGKSDGFLMPGDYWSFLLSAIQKKLPVELIQRKGGNYYS